MRLRFVFRLAILLVLVLAFVGAFSLLKTGRMTQDNSATIFPVIGVIVIWLLGGIVLWFSRGSLD
jgi:hypothetical protein